MNYEQVKKDLIHPWERPMRIVNVILFFIVIIGASVVLCMHLTQIVSLSEDYLNGILMAFGLLIIVIFQMGRQYGKSRANSIQLSEKQFPEIYQIVVNFSEKLELGYVPEVYLIQEGGVLNAFATSFLKKKYISINADIFELAYLEHKDLDTLAFIIGHELTHLKRQHATTKMVLFEIYASVIPIWGMAFSRVREYTCDRHAGWLAPEGKEGLILLAAGKHLYKQVDMNEYLKTSQEYKGLFLWIHNLLASHPIAPKRMQAVMDTSKWGKVF